MKNKTAIKRSVLASAVCAVFAAACCASAAAASEESASAEQTQTAAGIYDAAELFTDRDLEQTADLADATRYTLSDGKDIVITEEGVYVLTGEAENVTVTVEAGDEDKVQLVLDGVTVVNDDFPCVYVKSADKVFVTTCADSALSVTGTFKADGDTNTDGVIFSRDDLVLGGTAQLTIASSENGVVSKDDLKVTGGTYVIDAKSKCLEANDSIRVADGTLTLTAGTDGLHAENDDDDSLGYVYIGGGELSVDAGDDAIHGTSVVQIDDGTIRLSAAEGIEGTYVQLNGGTISIAATDDGINGAYKSTAFQPTVEITGGELTVVMASGDTDGIDCNGDLVITGGVIDVTGQSAFDYDGSASYTGGTIIVNGQQLDALPTQMASGFGGMRASGGMGGRGSRWGQTTQTTSAQTTSA